MSGQRDPTRSAGLRRQGRAQVNRKVFELNRQLRGVFDQQDVAGLRQRGGVGFRGLVLWIEANELRLARSEQAVGQIVNGVLADPAEWLRELIDRAVGHGVVQASRELKTDPVGLDYGEVSGAHAVAASSEIRGIAGETERRMMRNLFRAMEAQQTPEWLMREVRTVLEKVTRLRLILLVNTSVVRAVNAGKLFTYEVNGVRQVGIEPEWMPGHTHDSIMVHDVRSRKAKVRARKARNASKRVLDPIGKAILEAALGSGVASVIEEIAEQSGDPTMVNVLTAGDDKVCQDCEDIAADGPYEIAEARDLIPAHPNCRCAFIPFGDKRFAPIEEQMDEDEWT